MAHLKVFRRFAYGLISLAALAFCACTQVPDYCGDGQSSFDTKNQFCFGGAAYWKCGGKTYDPIHYQCNDKGQIVAKTDTVPTTYAVTVSSAGTGAIGAGSYAAGAAVTIYAGAPPSGKQFKNWTTASAGVTLADANSATTTFSMPKNAVTVTANFEAATVTPPVTPNTYLVTVSSAGSGSSGGGNYAAGATVTIKAGTAPSGQRFKNWTTASNGVTFVNANSATTTFTMPLNAVVVTAVFEQVVFAVTVTSAGTGATGDGGYEVGATVTISAGTPPSGQRFKNWTATGVTLANANNATTTFTMPKNTVTVAAVFEQLPSYVTFTDSRDNQTYNTVKIGSQVWMAENLNYDTADGTGSWCYENSPDSCSKYGRLYNWMTAMVVDEYYIDGHIVWEWKGSDVNYRGVCPAGWHLPSREEWDILMTAVGGEEVAGKKLRATNGWYDCDEGGCGNGVVVGTDDYGFSALPGGLRELNGDFKVVGERGSWWTAPNKATVWYTDIWVTYSYFDLAHIRAGHVIYDAYSVRCVQD